MATQSNHLTCIDCGRSDETVIPTWTSDQPDYRTFDRCPPCFDKRVKVGAKTVRRTMEAIRRRW